MKYVRILSIVSSLYFIIFLSWNCNDNEIDNSSLPTNYSNNSINKTENQTDGPGSSDVSMYIQEYVQLTTDGGNSFTETIIQIASFQGCNCFPISGPPHMEYNSFTTPPAGWRDIGGGQWVRSLSSPKFRIMYMAGWTCENVWNNNYLHWYVQNGIDLMIHILSNSSNCSTDPAKKTGSYYNISADITNWSNSESHNVQYGVDGYQDDE